MLWEHNSTIVVMLTKLREMGRVRILLGAERGCVAALCGHILSTRSSLCPAPATVGQPTSCGRPCGPTATYAP